MGLDEFTEEAMRRLQKELGEDYAIEKKTLDGLNGTKKHSLLASKAGTGAFPCINMDWHYERYLKGEDFDALLQRMLEECRKAQPVQTTDMEEIFHWDSIKRHIFAKLINTEKNEELLRKVPHRQYLDLSLVYCARITTRREETLGSILIRREHMERWEADESALCREAWKNLEEADEMDLEDMDGILRRMFGAKDPVCKDETGMPGMYVLGSKARINGAAQMYSRRSLKKAAETIGGDFWILPSSVHELVLIPVRSTESDARELAEMVRGVNDTQLNPDEILSYHVYRYSKDTETLSIAA